MVGSYHNNENNAGTMKVSVAFSRVSGEALIVSEVTPTEVLSVNYKELFFFKLMKCKLGSNYCLSV